MKNIFITLLVACSVFLLLGAFSVLAQEGTGDTGEPDGTGDTGGTGINIDFPNPFRGDVDSLYGLLGKIINDILLPIGGVLAVLAFIYSGFLYVTAQGNESKIATAHKALLYTAIGTALLLGSWVFASVICNTIGELGGPICPTI